LVDNRKRNKKSLTHLSNSNLDAKRRNKIITAKEEMCHSQLDGIEYPKEVQD
jgi:hypothetical protein